MNLKLAVVIRKDLKLENMIGRFAAQVAHISSMAMSECILKMVDDAETTPPEELRAWLLSPYLYIYEVNTREEMDALIEKGRDNKAKVHTWIDTVPANSLGGSIEVPVGFSIGPCDSDLVTRILGNLNMYEGKVV